MAYRIEFTAEAEEDLAEFRANDKRTLRADIIRHLQHEPKTPTPRRKHLRPNEYADWELRIEDFRVLYDVEDAPEPVVWIKIIAIKDHELLLRRGKVLKL